MDKTITARITGRFRELLAEARVTTGTDDPSLNKARADIEGRMAGNAWEEVASNCRRSFDPPGEAETRVMYGEGGPVMRCPDMVDLVRVTVGGEEAPAVLYPLAGPPFRWIAFEERRADGGNTITTSRNIPEGAAVRVTARWGYSEDPPADIIEAAALLAARHHLEDLDMQERNPDLDPFIAAYYDQAAELMKPHRRWLPLR